MAEGELVTLQASASTVELLNRSEIDTQIATARKFPRSITTFIQEAKGLVSLSTAVAGECSYALPRGGKTITGPSARFAEIIASCWGNSRAGARVVNEDGRFVTAQGVFHDLQRNLAITYETQRRITDKNGRTYQDDMIGVTANAACSIALRNAILKGIPKAFWNEIYQAAVATAKGDLKTLPQRRKAAMEAARQIGFADKELFQLLNIKGEADIDIDKLFELSGILTALNDGDTTKAELLKEIAPAKGEAPTPPKIDAPAKPKPEAKPEAEAQEAEPLRSAPEVLEELENVVSGVTEIAELLQIEEEYLDMKELVFPEDKDVARMIIAKQREFIKAQQ